MSQAEIAKVSIIYIKTIIFINSKFESWLKMKSFLVIHGCLIINIDFNFLKYVADKSNI